MTNIEAKIEDQTLTSTVASDTVKKEFELTELGNAMRLDKLIGREYMWTPENQMWNHFAGKVWKVDQYDSIYNRIHEVLADIESETAPIIEKIKQLSSNLNVIQEVTRSVEHKEYKRLTNSLKAYQKWRKTSQSQRAIKAMIDLTKVQPGMSASIKDFDSKAHYLGAKNGIVDLRSGDVIAEDSSYLVSKASPVNFTPEPNCPMFKSFLFKIMMDRKEMVDFLQVLMGSAAVGHKSAKFFIFYGEKGGNGKSTLVDLIIHILGDYAAVSNPNILTSTGNTSDYYLAQTQGKRLIVFNETTKEDVQLAESLIKTIADSGMITARHPACRPFQFQPVFTPIFCVNHLPNASMDPALWRRLVIVPFDYQIPVDERDPEFVSKLIQEEGQGVLNWIVEGAQKYLNEGLKVPKSILQATRQAQSDMDVIGQFLSQECIENPTAKIKLKDLNIKFTAWAEEHQFKKRYAATTFARELRDRDIEVRTSTGKVNWVFGWTTLEEHSRNRPRNSGVIHNLGSVLKSMDELVFDNEN